MKRTLIVSLALYISVFLIPLLTPGGRPDARSEEPDIPSPTPVPSPEVTVTPPPSPIPRPPDGRTVTVLIGGTPGEIELGEFIAGSVAAEMPALYPEEALKAQAVAIRTYTLFSEERPRHEDAWLCDRWECCLAYAPISANAEVWGDRYEEFAEKIKAAVEETDGVVILFDGELIDALFFAATDGRTRSAAEVWGREVPYLQSVDSVFCLEFPNGPRGHGVGMSQFGARQLAFQGFSYEEILHWYYSGVEVR
jgi:stage II sporulation protein D